jgi:hypothetical protein
MHAEDKDRVWTQDTGRPPPFEFEKWARQFQGIGAVQAVLDRGATSTRLDADQIYLRTPPHMSASIGGVLISLPLDARK